MNEQTNTTSDYSHFSYFANNISALYKDNNTLGKEFRDGEIRDKGMLGRTSSFAQTLLWGGIDYVRGSNRLGEKQEARRNELLQRNWDYHKPVAQQQPPQPEPVVPAGPGGQPANPAAIPVPAAAAQKFPDLNPEDIHLLNKMTAQFAERLGTKAPLEFLHHGIERWVEKEQENIPLPKEALSALKAIYNSGIDPEILDKIAQKNPSSGYEPEELATIAQILNIFDKVQTYAKTVDKSKKDLFKEEADGSLSWNADLFGVNLRPAEREALETYMNTYNCMPHKTIGQILKISEIVHRPDFLHRSSFRDLYLAELQQKRISDDVPIVNDIPLPTQQQLQIAVEVAYRIFGEVPHFENVQARAFFARSIQYMLVGDKVGLIPYPEDDCCFAFQEMYVRPEHEYYFNTPPPSKRSDPGDWDSLRNAYQQQLARNNLPEVRMIEGKPRPSQKQLELAASEAIKLFPDLSDLQNVENRVLFTRLLDYILVGETNIETIPYPSGDNSLTFHEILELIAHSADVTPSNYTLAYIKSNGGLPNAFGQFLKDYARPLTTQVNTIVFNKKEYSFPKTVVELVAFLQDYAIDFQNKMQDQPDFLFLFAPLLPHLPVSDEAFAELIQQMEANSFSQKELAQTLKRFEFVIRRTGKLSAKDQFTNACWRVAILQLLIHLHQGIPGELLRTTADLALPIQESVSAATPRTTPFGHKVYLEPTRIIAAGAVNLEVRSEVLEAVQTRPNFSQRIVEGTPFTTIARVRSEFEAPLLSITGGHSRANKWISVTIPAHMVFQTELLNGLFKKRQPLEKTTLSQAKELVEEMRKIPFDSLKILAQVGKPSTWDHLDLLMDCLNLREKTDFIDGFKTELTKYKKFITVSGGIYQLKEDPLTTEEVSKLPPIEFRAMVDLVETMNLLGPHLGKIAEIRKVAALSTKPNNLSQLGWLHTQFLTDYHRQYKLQNPGLPVPVRVLSDVTVQPTPLQLYVALDCISLAQEKGGIPLPESSSQQGKAFLGRLIQLILVGPERVESLTYPEDEFATTRDLAEFVLGSPRIIPPTDLIADFPETEEILPNDNGLKVIPPRELIQQRLRGFANQKSQFFYRDQFYDITKKPEELRRLLQGWKNDFFRWSQESENLQLCVAQFDRARHEWNMELSQQELQSLFWNAGLGAWFTPIVESLNAPGNIQERLWAFHLLQVALICQPNHFHKHYGTTVANIVNPAATYEPLPEQITAIYDLNRPTLTATYNVPLRQGADPHAQINVQVRVVQDNLYQVASPELAVSPIKFSPYGRQAIQTIHKNIFEKPGAGVGL